MLVHIVYKIKFFPLKRCLQKQLIFFARTFVCEFFQYGFTVLEVVQNIYSFDTNPDLYQDIQICDLRRMARVHFETLKLKFGRK